ncbi:hypothetical protein BLOT_014765 [Blomia tropicalis]|nr:hypothetical protein BLOT_014765 [Blomia tropicalis]
MEPNICINDHHVLDGIVSSIYRQLSNRFISFRVETMSHDRLRSLISFVPRLIYSTFCFQLYSITILVQYLLSKWDSESVAIIYK